MKNNDFFIHLFLAGIVSFAISGSALVFWDIFNATGFWVASITAAIFGAGVGWASGRYLIATLVATLLVRSAILFFVLNG